MKQQDNITLTVEVEYDRGEDELAVPRAFVVAFDGKGRRLASAAVHHDHADLELPREVGGQSVRIFHASAEFDLKDTASLPRLQRYLAVEKRFYVDPGVADLRLRLPTLDLTLWLKACCRVRGNVSMRIKMPNGKVRFAPLCNARLQIYEVDHTLPMIIKALPDHLVYRLRDEWMEAIQNPVVQVDPSPEVAAVGEGLRVALAPADDRQIAPAQVGLRQQLQPVFDLQTATQLREAIIPNIGLLRPYLCYFDWLYPFHDLDLLKTVDIAEDGTFDTHIWYPCYGDKPDLYFKVQQDCHEGGWLTVYEPPIHCNTYWNYCCGTKVNIRVTHPKAAPGLSLTPCVFPYDTSDPAVMGKTKELPYETPIDVANAALLHTGEVLFLPGSDISASRVWNPLDEVTADFETPSPDVTDRHYCSGHAFLADGRLLVIGGGGNSSSNAIKSTWTFEPHSKTWTQVTDMEYKRWYPTAVTLSDGRVLAVSGSGGGGINKVEVYDPIDDRWDPVTGADYNNLDGTYPGLHLLPSGDVIFTRTGWNAHSGDKSAILHFTGEKSGVWQDEYDMEHPDRHSGMSVILLRNHEFAEPGAGEDEPAPLDPPIPYARILVIGGGGGDRWPAPGNDPCPNGNMVEKIDLPPLSGTPSWTEVDHLNYKRCDVNAVLLPDGTVLALGGVNGGVNSEIYEPDEDKWTKVEPLEYRRKYHSLALLLPSGKVMITGARHSDTYVRKIELYSPPYLFRGPRPTYTIADHHFHHDADFTIESPDACRIKKVGLMRPSAVTHQTDSEQRYVLMDFEREGKCQLKIRAPKNGAIAPPGHYMLFIVDDCGIPSEAKFVDLH